MEKTGPTPHLLSRGNCNENLALSQLQELLSDTRLLLEGETALYTSSEDAAYFRSLVREKKIVEKADLTPSQPPREEVEIVKPSPPPISHTPSENMPIPLTDPDLNPSVKAPSKDTAPPWRTDVFIPAEPLNFQGLRNFFQKAFPDISILDQIPSDEEAKRIAGRWKTKNKIAPITVLFLTEPTSQKNLLQEIAKAIDVYFGPAKLVDAAPIEKEKQWETFLSSQDLKHIIICDYTLWQLKELMKFYKETAPLQKRTLKQTPLFLLPDLSLYSKDPLLKRSLWKSLCLKLSS